MARGKAKSPEDMRRHIVATAMTMAERDGWRPVTMAGISRESGISLPQLLSLMANKACILGGLARQIDETVLSDLAKDGETGDTPKDRLFDILMRRFDALSQYKGGLAAVVHGLPGDPVTGVWQMLRLHCSMAMTLEAAEIPSAGIAGLLRTKGLTLVFANACRVWFRDDSEDMSATMAAIDRGLSLADRIVAKCAAAKYNPTEPQN